MTITKTVRQYSSPLPPETMDFLRGIASDYSKVKKHVYGRYSGIGSVGRLTPVYTVLNEMRSSGLRAALGLPVVYFELAVAEAVTNIKTMWGILKNKIRELINLNENLSDEDRLYIRTVLKLDNILAAILNRREYEMPKRTEGLFVDTHRLNNLIRRLVRRHLGKPQTRQSVCFRVTPAGFKYKDNGLYLVSRTPRQRVFIPMKDKTTSDRQIQIHILEDSIMVTVVRDVDVREFAGQRGTACIYIGYRDMFTLPDGNVYGKGLNELVSPETRRLDEKNRERGKIFRVYAKAMAKGDVKKAERIAKNNLGKKKYLAQKRRERSRTENFINAEINRMLRTEKPKTVVITKPVTKERTKYHIKTLNRNLTRSFGGYIRERLAYKCRLYGIELIEINPKNTGSLCSSCGAEGVRKIHDFICEKCGFEASIAKNSARNIKKIADQTAAKDD